MRYFVLLPAAGNGVRFGGDRPKQYSTIGGKTLLQHSLERLAAGIPLARAYVALSDHDVWFESEVAARADVTALRCGGATRAETVANSLRAMDAAPDDWILVHDAVRPCIDESSLGRLLREVGDDAVGGLLAVPAAATLKRADEHGRSVRTEPRERIWHAQTPQMFRYTVLRDALSRPGFEHVTDEAQAVEAIGLHPRLVVGSRANVKVTYPDDLLLAAAIMAQQAL
ncbi:MAG: 2-C-methyl-D-erythritol 4-phosphate cytidylyltransferase [Burkholderiales bacterium]|nr:2-C-methyl-D-erythritol 4-phosphate cytidylyltransferase [Burkholderiales bacterium]